MEIINTTEALKGKPRPHYLVGDAKYSFEQGEHILIAHALFPSSRDSVGDRAKAPIPHANIADAYFGLWNAVHIICEKAGVFGTLTSSGGFKIRRPIPPDTELEFKVTLGDIEENERHVRAHYAGIYSLGGRELCRLSGNGIGKKKLAVPSEVRACYGPDIKIHG